MSCLPIVIFILAIFFRLLASFEPGDEESRVLENIEQPVIELSVS